MGTQNKRHLSVAALAVILFVTTASATDKCRTGCQGVKPKLFKYEEGTTYKYKLDGNIDFTLSGADQQQTSSRIQAQVLLTQLKDCQQLIRLDKVQVHGPSTSQKYDLGADLKKGVRILFHDGHVEDEICTETGDTQASLNIKRAVISMFQAATKSKSEIDVFGSCPTTIAVNNQGAVTTIRKTRDLNRCAFRESISQDFITAAFDPRSDIKSTPLLSSDYVAEQTIKGGILQDAKITEHYLYKPFSLGQNGAKAVVTTKIHLTGHNKDAAKPKGTEPKSILFENPHLVNTPSSNVNNLKNALKKALDSSTGNEVISPQAARDFAALVNIIRVTSKNDVLAVFSQVKAGAGIKPAAKEAAKKLFFEALYRAGTGDSIEVAVDLLLAKEIPANRQRLFYLSLSMVKHATSSSLAAAAKILDQHNLPREAYLGVGTLAGRYCRDHKCDRDNNLDKLTKKFIQKLNNCKATNREGENTVVALLKGLGNFKHINDAIVDTLIKCASDRSAHPRIRVAALETFLADSAKPKLKKAAMAILQDRDEDSEIRIKAYLVIAQSPCGDMANQLKDLLATEPVNQVGSFIVSHLRNIRSSSNPNKDLAKQHLSLIRSPKRFPIDVRRFSFNSELSYAIDTLGIASSLESNVIYSQDSFLPRSANLNFTSEIFGHNLNVLELGVRQENLDRLIEHYLGPRGVLQSSDPTDVIESSKQEIKQIVEKLRQRVEKTKRGRRDVSEATLNDFAKVVKLATTRVGTALDIDLSVKLFGSEVIFATINEAVESFTPEVIIDKIFDQLDAGLEKAKAFEHTFGGHAQFLDVETAYPTSLGFPLKLSVIGSAVVQVAASSNVDVRKVIQDPTNAKVLLKLVPSANVELLGSFIVDAYSVETGLQIATNLHTATGSDISVQILNGGKGIDVKFGLPIQNQDLMTVSHDIVFQTQELGHQATEVALKFTGQRKEYRGCFDQLASFIGLTFCGEVGVPVNSLPGVPLGGKNAGASPFPLSGPAKFSVQIQRDDSKEYHFRANYINDKPDKRKVELSFDTPNSKIKRRINLVVEGGTEPEGKYLTATLDLPGKTAVAEGRIIHSNEELSLNAKLAYDKQEYSGKVGVIGKGSGTSLRLTPLIEFKTPKGASHDVNGYKVEGAIVVENTNTKKTYKFENVRLVSPNASPITINGIIGKDGPKYEADLQISQDKHKGSLKSSITFVSPENVKLAIEVQNSLNPNLNVHIIGEHKRNIQAKEGKGEFENKFEIIHGQDLKTSKNRFALENSGKFAIESIKKFDIGTKNKIEYALVNLVVKADARLTCHSLDWDVLANYEKFKVTSQMKSTINQKSQGNYDIDFKVDAMGNKLLLTSSREVTGPSKSKLKNMLQVQDKKVELDADVVHQFQTNDVNAQLTAVLKISGRPNPISISEGLVLNAQKIDIHSDIKDGATKLVDVKFNSNRVNNAHGDLKINLGEIVQADGNLVLKDGKGTGSITIDIKKIGRKVKGDTTFTVSKPTYNAKININLNVDKEPSQKISIETTNQIQDKSISSKNKINLFDNVIEANLNGKLQGEIANGVISGDADLLLPTGHYIAGKVNRDVKSNGEVVNVKASGEVEISKSKTGKGFKLIGNISAKDTNLKRHVFDISGSINAIKPEGQNLEVSAGAKHGHTGENRDSHLSFKVQGSAYPYVTEGTLDAEYGKKFYRGKTQLKCTSGISGTLDAKLDLGSTAENKYAYDISGNLVTGSDKFKKIAFYSQSMMARPLTDTELFEVSTSNGLGVNDNIVKMDGSLRGNKDQGSGKVSVNLSDGTPVTASANYKRSGPGAIQIGADLTQTGKDGKDVKLGVDINKPNNNQIVIRVNALSPVESARSVDLSVTLKRSDDNKNLNSDIVLSTNGKKYSLSNNVVISETSPVFELKLTSPDNKVSRILAKFTRASKDQISGELIISNIRDFSLEASGSANLESAENFLIKLKLNSEKLNWKNINVEIMNEPTKDGNRVKFSALSGSTNIISGSTSFESKEEAGKQILHGSGEISIKNDKKSANFKLISSNLDESKGEKGAEIKLDASVGSRKLVGDLIISNKQIHFRNEYCDEKKNCAHIEVTSKHIAEDMSSYTHELTVSVDLLKIGINNEFGLKSVYTRKELDIQHVIDLYFLATEKQAYQYKFYASPKKGGLILTLPKREIAIEGDVDVDIKQAPKIGKASASLVIYLDKKRLPNQKLSISAKSTINVDGDKSAAANGEIKLSHPALKKDLILSGKINANRQDRITDFSANIDIFANANQKFEVVGKFQAAPISDKGFNITSDIKIDSKGQNIHIQILEHASGSVDGVSFGHHVSCKSGGQNRQATALFVANKQQLEILLQSWYLTQPFHLDAKYSGDKKHAVIKSTVNIFGLRHLIQEVEIKDYNTVMFSQYSKETPSDKLSGVAAFIPGQLTEIRLDTAKGGAKQPLAHATLRLDDAHFLQSDYGANVDNIKAYLEVARTETSQIVDGLKQIAGKAEGQVQTDVKEVKEKISKAMPNFKPILEEYKKELKQLRQEIISDKKLEEVQAFIHNTFGAAAATISELLNRITELIEKIYKALEDNFNNIAQIYNEKLYPQMKALADKFYNIVLGIAKEISDIVFLYIAKAAEIIKAHQAELNKIATSISEVGQDVGRTIAKALAHIRKELENFVNAVIEQIKALPITEVIKEKYKELTGSMNVPEHILEVLDEFVNTAKGLMPTPEFQEVLDVTYNYLVKKLRQQKVDDAAALKQIYAALEKAVKSVLKMLHAEGTIEGLQNFISNNIPTSFGAVTKIPSIISVQLSPIKYLFSDDLPTLSELIYAYRPRINPLDNIPPFSLNALIVDGQHIFTFDQRHISFPGSCNYLLARDMLDGNFSIVANLHNGEIKSIQLVDKSGSLTVKKDGSLLKNNKPSEYPAKLDTAGAWRGISSPSINLASRAGVFIQISPNLRSVMVKVSGFYRNRLRGLLGNPNDEQYDDFIKPNGKIAKSEGEFGNSYKIGKCGDVKVQEHTAVTTGSPVCNQLFSSESTLRFCFPVINPANFRQACEHAISSGKQDTACWLAGGYAAACKDAGLPAQVPPSCVKCDLGDGKKLNFAETVTLQTPAGKADVMILIEQAKENEVLLKELVTPLVQQLQAELKSRGITDVNFALVGHGDGPWPALYTNGGKVEYQGKPTTMNFVERQEPKAIATGNEKVDKVLSTLQKVAELIRKDLGLNAANIAAFEVSEYPFRPTAARTVIVIQEENCYAHRLRVGVSTLNSLFMQEKYRWNGVSMNVITPLTSLTVDEKDQKAAKNIIGFNSDTVYTLGDKKKHVEANQKLRDALDMDADSCISFAERSNGAVFSSSVFKEAKGPQRKQYIQVLTKVIADQLVDTKYTRDCVCGLKKGIVPRTYCVVSSRQGKDNETGFWGDLAGELGDAIVSKVDKLAEEDQKSKTGKKPKN